MKIKKSLIFLELMVKIAKVLALSKKISLIGGVSAKSALDAIINVLKYDVIYSAVILMGKFVLMINKPFDVQNDLYG